MVRVKVDNRIRTLIENADNFKHRALFVIVGEKSRDQAITLYHIMNKTQHKTRPSVLWCYKKELGFSTHRKKRMKELQKMKKVGTVVNNEENPLDMFISSADIRWCYYHETKNILGQTFQMAVLQDFEAMQPNLLARTIETVEGGGLVVILLNTLNSLKQFYTMSMDVHSRYRTESHQDVVSRFNERFILSLIDCKNCCIIDDQLNVIPVSPSMAQIKLKHQPEDINQNLELTNLIDSLVNQEPLRSLVSLCKTVDQAQAVIKFSEVLMKKTTKATVALTASRGRGKSAALGLAMASAIAYGYSNIHVTSPSPENLHTLFDFAIRGLKAMHLLEHNDFTVIKSMEHENTVVKIHVFKDNNQTIQYIDPIEASQSKLSVQLSNLFIIDEAAAIPLPIVRSFLASPLVFLSSTINGYEGTGRSLSLKLLNQLRQNSDNLKKTPDTLLSSRLLHELTLDEPIRYKNGDPIEAWLNQLLCLDANINELPWNAGCPVPDQCQLHYINRDTLFSYHEASEKFLNHLMTLYVASHYKNTPNDLQMMSDAPAHHLFCLLPPMRKPGVLPEVLCFVQICLEGQISKESILNSLSRGKRAASGDLIPWTIARQYNEENFASLSGARIVRIATNPNYQKMGYGSRALQLIFDYYSGAFSVDISENNQKSKEVSEKHLSDNIALNEEFKPRSSLPPLLMNLNEREAEKLDYLGVSFGLTPELLKFWKRSKYIPVYIRQTPNDITGEHSCIMIRRIVPFGSETSNDNGEDVCELEMIEKRKASDWLKSFYIEFTNDFFELLVHQFRHFDTKLALGMIRSIYSSDEPLQELSLDRDELYKFFLTSRKLAILEMYSKTLAEYHQILPMLLRVSKLYFLGWLPKSVDLSAVQAAILLAVGVQGKTINQAANELGLESSQLLGLFGRAIKKIETHLRTIERQKFADEVADETKVPEKLSHLAVNDNDHFAPIKESLQQELSKAARKMTKKLHVTGKISKPAKKKFKAGNKNKEFK